MSTIKDKIYFTYDNVNSRDFGLMHIETGNGMFEEQLVADRTIIETSTRNGKPLLNRIDEKPISFTMNLAFERRFDEYTIDEIVDWLFQDYYKPLYFEGKEDRIYYCPPEGSSSIVHYGLVSYNDDFKYLLKEKFNTELEEMIKEVIDGKNIRDKAGSFEMESVGYWYTDVDLDYLGRVMYEMYAEGEINRSGENKNMVYCIGK